MYVQIKGILCECLFCDFCFMILNAIFTEPTSFCNQFSLTTLFHLLHKLHDSQHEVSRRDRIWNQTRYWYICKIKTFCPGSSPCSLVVRFMFQAIDPSSTFSAVVRQIIASSFLSKCRQPWFGPIPRQQTHGHTLVCAGAHFSRTTMGLKIRTWIFHVFGWNLLHFSSWFVHVILVQSAVKNDSHSSSALWRLWVSVPLHIFLKLLCTSSVDFAGRSQPKSIEFCHASPLKRAHLRP